METKPQLSPAFQEFASYLDPATRVLVSAKRSESIQELFRSRRATLDTRDK